MKFKNLSFPWIGLVISLLLILSFSSFQTNDQPSVNSQEGSPSQLERDTTEARKWIEIAKSFQDSTQFDSALIYFEQAAASYRSYLEKSSDTALWMIYLECGNQIGVCYWNLADYEKSLNQLWTILEEGKKNLGENHSEVARSYSNIGIVYGRQGTYKAALENYQKGLKIYLNTIGENHSDVARIYHNMGLIYKNQGVYETALENYQKGLKIYLSTTGENHLDVARIYNNIGLIYWIQGFYEAALGNYQKGLKIYLNTAGEKDPFVAGIYFNTGLVYMSQGFYEAALENYQNALKVFISAFGENHSKVASCYAAIGFVYSDQEAYESALENLQMALKIWLNTFEESHPMVLGSYLNIGLVYMSQGAYEAALENYHKALTIGLDIFGENHHSVAFSYGNIGMIHINQGAYELALENLQKALTINIDTYGEKHLIVARNYGNIGNVYLAQGNYETTLENYHKALMIFISIFGESHPEVANNYHNIGVVYGRQGIHQSALENYQNALIANCNNFKEQDIEINPTLNHEVLSEPFFLKTLQKKAYTLFTLSRPEVNDSASLQLAYHTYQLAVGLADKMRQDYKRQKDKQELLKSTSVIYEGAIQTALELYRKTERDSFLQQAFTAFEKSRSILLLENLQNVNAKAFAGIPDELIAREKEVSIQLAFFEKSLFEEQLKKEAADSVKLSHWQDKIFQLRQFNDSIIQVLETKYPDYYRLKHNLGVASLVEAQNLLPDSEATLLEYFVGDSSIYVFIISQQDYQCIEIQKDFPLEEWVQSLRESIYGYHLSNDRSQQLYEKSMNTLVFTSHALYQKLITPISTVYQLPEKLIISPDGVLGYLPFELLLTALPEDLYTFHNHAWLLKDHQISYVFSATLLQEMQEKQLAWTKSDFIAFAPSFKEDKEIAENSIMAELRGNLGSLSHNIQEAEAIQQLLGGKVFTENEATEAAFVENASSYRIIHLATHGIANDKIGDYAYLAFSEIPDSIENEKLYNRDLYNLNLNADMVVLSACETGIGELQRGEGIISLARGFSYAGAKSLITSLWSVDDSRTRELMEDYYHYIKAGKAKDEALRLAKLDFLAKYRKVEAHPFYWAPFIAMGDMSPLHLRPRISPLWWVLVGLIGILSFFNWRARVE